MHDPNTVAFEIPRPWPEKSKVLGWHWPALITIWHRDPEKDGDEDSCNFSGFHKTGETGWCGVVLDDYKTLSEDQQRVVNFIWWAFKSKLTERRWWQHPKFHFWHWRIQIHALQQLKRFLFSRCTKCGKRFTWNDAGGHVIGTWDGRGPQWFTNGEKIWHFGCHAPASAPTAFKPEETSTLPVN